MIIRYGLNDGVYFPLRFQGADYKNQHLQNGLRFYQALGQKAYPLFQGRTYTASV